MAPPVRRDSVLWVEQALTTFTNDDVVSFPSDDDASSLPCASSSDFSDPEEFYDQFPPVKPVRHDSPLSLPDSSPPASPPASPLPYEDDSPNGLVYLFDKANRNPLFFQIPSTNGFFCLLNSPAFLEQSRIATHPLKVYDAMLGSFVDLPPIAYWRQVTSDYHYLILKDGSIDDDQCIGLKFLINDLDDPTAVIAMSRTCLNIWHHKRVKTPPSTQVPLPIPSQIQGSSKMENGVGKKRKRSVTKDEVSGPPKKVLKSSKNDKGTKCNPIVISN